mmetsp:Transcript_19302/g.13863  ORF Transcript_19302/g.13863 Transcript_19302/m.13863 type:complete len:99 (-) Transcript_19302:508-804(-)
MFGKMDPYCVITYREETFKTDVKNNAGKKPKWDQTYQIDVKYVGDDINVKVYDKDVFGSDYVGQANIKWSSLCMNGGMDDWFDLMYSSKKAGSIRLKC